MGSSPLTTMMEIRPRKAQMSPYYYGTTALTAPRLGMYRYLKSRILEVITELRRCCTIPRSDHLLRKY